MTKAMRYVSWGALLVLLAGAPVFGVPVTGLYDWSAYIDGATFNPPALPGYVNTGSFNFTTGIGTVTWNLSGMTPGVHTFGMWFDAYVDEGFANQFNEYATVAGAAPAGLSYIADWPASSWPIFSSGSFASANNVPTAADPPAACCDVSIGILWTLTVTPGDPNVVKFMSDFGAGGFAIYQTDKDSLESIRYSSTYGAGGGPPPSPEPATMGLLGAGLAALAIWRRKVC